MKKLICGLLSVACILPSLLLCGCGISSSDDGKLTVVTTTFAAYDWTRQILGERIHDSDVELVLMTDNGTDMHSYQPTFDDRIAVTSCDLLIHVGGADDTWLEDALAGARSKPATVNLMAALGDKIKTQDISTDHDNSCSDEEHHHGEGAKDEHVWLSLRYAATFCDIIAKELTALDPAHGAAYQKNAQSYIGQLNELDSRYTATVQAAQRNTVLFGDRFPFRYLLDDYGIHYLAAFPGCSADTHASFETVAHLAEQVDALDLPCILTVTGSSGNIASAIVRSTAQKNQAVLSMDAMQAISAATVDSGATYLSIMGENLNVLTSALN